MATGVIAILSSLAVDLKTWRSFTLVNSQILHACELILRNCLDYYERFVLSLLQNLNKDVFIFLFSCFAYLLISYAE